MENQLHPEWKIRKMYDDLKKTASRKSEGQPIRLDELRDRILFWLGFDPEKPSENDHS